MSDIEQANQTDGIPVQCTNCGYQWTYSGKYTLDDEDAVIGCYGCESKVKLVDAAEERQGSEAEELVEDMEPEPDDSEHEYTATALILVELHAKDREVYKQEHGESPPVDEEPPHQWWAESDIIDGEWLNGGDMETNEEKVRVGLEQIRRQDLADWRWNEGELEYKLYDDWQERRSEAFDAPMTRVERIEELEESVHRLARERRALKRRLEGEGIELEGLTDVELRAVGDDVLEYDVQNLKEERDKYKERWETARDSVQDLKEERDEYMRKWEKARDVNTEELIAGKRGIELETDERVRLIYFAVEADDMDLARKLLGEEGESE